MAGERLLVPEVAIGTDQGGRYVLAVNGENIVEQRRVQLGQTFGDMRAVESGLKPDERIVVAGILDAIPGQRSIRSRQAPKSARADEKAPNSPSATRNVARMKRSDIGVASDTRPNWTGAVRASGPSRLSLRSIRATAPPQNGAGKATVGY